MEKNILIEEQDEVLRLIDQKELDEIEASAEEFDGFTGIRIVGRVQPEVKVQKAEIEQQENFMKTLKDIYNSDDMVEMQTKLEVYFENIDSCLLNKYKYESSISLLSA